MSSKRSGRAIVAASAWLAACVPISTAEYAAGTQDAGAPNQHDDDAAPARDAGDAGEFDAAALDARTADAAPLGADARDGFDRDAASDGGAPATDPATSAFCTSSAQLCDDFERTPPKCPEEDPVPWNACEQTGGAPPVSIVFGGPPRYNALFSSSGLGSGSRGARLSGSVPANSTWIRAEFDFLPQPGLSPPYTLGQLEQQAGLDPAGQPTHLPGISLIARDGQLLLLVQRVSDLARPVEQEVVALRPLPSVWTRVRLELSLSAELVVTVQFDGESPRTFPPYVPSAALITGMNFRLGVHTEGDGNAAVLYDNVVVSHR